ncbi:hypothetical protein [Streptomyces sp. M92]|nr:hypothetical protein [Streptomyces sp. M92]
MASARTFPTALLKTGLGGGALGPTLNRIAAVPTRGVRDRG